MEEDFEILAAKVLAGEATADEARRLQEMLAQDPNLRADFASLDATWAALNEVGRLAEAFDAPPAAPPPPRLQSWRNALAGKFDNISPIPISPAPAEWSAEPSMNSRFRKRIGLSPLRLALAAVCVAMAIVATILLRLHPPAPVGYLMVSEGTPEVRRDGKSFAVSSVASVRASDEIRLATASSATLLTSTRTLTLQGPEEVIVANLLSRPDKPVDGAGANAKVQAVHDAVFEPVEKAFGLLITTRSGPGIPIYSPAGFTANLTPLILWKTQPGKSYDVSIVDELESTSTPLRRTGVSSPLAFTNAWPGRMLGADGLYRLRIAETGKPLSATELVFRTQSGADRAPADKTAGSLLAAYRMLTASPARLGDALAVLLTLPPEVANSELALRLQLFALGQLGYQEDFDTTLARIKPAK